jgi:hypothetical protein
VLAGCQAFAAVDSLRSGMCKLEQESPLVATYPVPLCGLEGHRSLHDLNRMRNISIYSCTSSNTWIYCLLMLPSTQNLPWYLVPTNRDSFHASGQRLSPTQCRIRHPPPKFLLITVRGLLLADPILIKTNSDQSKVQISQTTDAVVVIMDAHLAGSAADANRIATRVAPRPSNE